jgi:hypothetical protein
MHRAPTSGPGLTAKPLFQGQAWEKPKFLSGFIRVYPRPNKSGEKCLEALNSYPRSSAFIRVQ